MILSNLTLGDSSAHQPPPGIRPQVTEQLSVAEGTRPFVSPSGWDRARSRAHWRSGVFGTVCSCTGRACLSQTIQTIQWEAWGMKADCWGGAPPWDSGWPGTRVCACLSVCVRPHVCFWPGGREWGLLAAFKDSYTTDRKTGGISWPCHIVIKVKRLRQNRRASVCVYEGTRESMTLSVLKVTATPTFLCDYTAAFQLAFLTNVLHKLDRSPSAGAPSPFTKAQRRYCTRTDAHKRTKTHSPLPPALPPHLRPHPTAHPPTPPQTPPSWRRLSAQIPSQTSGSVYI